MKRTGLFCFIPSCYRCGQCRQGSRKISKIQNHFYPTEGTSHLDSALLWFVLDQVLLIHLLTPPLCDSVLCVWGGAGGAGDLWWWVSILSSSFHVLLVMISVGERKCWTCFRFPTDVTTDEWAFYLLPLDDDIISLELPEFFRDNFLVDDIHRVWNRAEMICQLT